MKEKKARVEDAMHATKAAVETPPPRLGEHTAEILGRIGYSDSDLTNLKQNGVI
jgi:crotonobetainyl-CoA:carnitine CoA-transferase CaiB-like acyl-CoA transferase